MELDELKEKWRQAGTHETPSRNSFKTIFRRRDQGPVAALKRNFRRQIIILSIVFFLFVHEFQNRELLNNVFFLWYAVCALLLCAFFFVNLQLVKRLETAGETLTAHVKSEIVLLEKRMKWQRVFTFVAIASLIVLLEVLPFFSDERMLNKWHSLAPVIRVSAYAALLLFRYFAGKLIAHRRYGRHVERLKKIMDETE